MKYNVKISERATKDMKDIVRYISEELYSPEIANKLFNKFSSAIFSLEDMPRRYNLVADEDLARKGIRIKIVGNYLIFFKVEIEDVIVVRVLYQKRDWNSLI